MFLLIDNYDSFTYNVFQAFAELGQKLEVVRNDAITLDEIRAKKPQGIVLSPGPGKPENAGVCVDVVRQLSGEFPILGVCLGHQAIATAFGGTVVNAGEIVHGKKTHVFHQGEGIFKYMPLPFEAGRYHSLIVERENLPSELKVVAENDGGLIMGVQHQSHPTFGVQFHPESILTPEGGKLIQAFVELSEC